MAKEFHDALEPDRTLVVRVLGAEAAGFAGFPERFPGASVVRFSGELPEAECRQFLRGLDVVYTVETGYDARFYDWAREEGCRSVCHVMPEFFHWWGHPAPSAPDVFWTPTTWWLDRLPPETRLVPVPAPARTARLRTAARTFVHVAGTRAAADRNGTIAVIQAAQLLKESCRLILRSQASTLPQPRLGSNVELVLEPGGVADRWKLYEDGDVLVLPRRYAGLSLPIIEALADGMAVIGTDREPERSTWPMLHVPTLGPGRTMRLEGATVRISSPPILGIEDPSPELLAAMMDSLVREPEAVADLSAAAIIWAQLNDWQTLAGLYLTELARAVELPEETLPRY